MYYDRGVLPKGTPWAGLAMYEIRTCCVDTPWLSALSYNLHRLCGDHTSKSSTTPHHNHTTPHRTPGVAITLGVQVAALRLANHPRVRELLASLDIAPPLVPPGGLPLPSVLLPGDQQQVGAR